MTTNEQRYQDLQDMAHLLRLQALEMTDESESMYYNPNNSHSSSCSSIAELLAVLFFDDSGMHYNPRNPKNPGNDKFILSKGHAAAIYYAAWAKAGNFPIAELKNYCKMLFDLEANPTPRLSCVDVATGSLGQGLGITCGMAYSSKYFDKIANRYFCILGDGECAEGSVWEAASFASHYKLNNLIAIIDVNKLGQCGPTTLGHDTDTYVKRFAAFGWHAVAIDGHSIKDIIYALEDAKKITGQPVAIIAKTVKGNFFFNIIENVLNWLSFSEKNINTISDKIRGLIKNPSVQIQPSGPINDFEWRGDLCKQSPKFAIKPDYEQSKFVSTREGYGNALKKLGDQDSLNQIVVLDADVQNSTYSEIFETAHPDRFINCYIAEQNMVSVALGISKRNKIPFVSTYGAFFTRAFDQIRMTAISMGNVKFFGSHSGVHIGKDGPTQMALEVILI
jgi:transketolase